MAAGADDLGGVRVEGHQHGGQPARPRRGDRRADQLLVAAVHAVEHPDGDDAASPPGRTASSPRHRCTRRAYGTGPATRGWSARATQTDPPAPARPPAAPRRRAPPPARAPGRPGRTRRTCRADPAAGSGRPWREVGGLVGVDVPPRRRRHGTAAASGSDSPGALLQLGQRPRVLQAERPDPGAPQRGQVPADAQRGAEVAGQRPDVGPGRALDDDVQVGAAAGEQRERRDRHRPRRQHDLLPRPHPRVRPPPVDLDRADRAGHLQDRAGQCGDAGGDRVVGDRRDASVVATTSPSASSVVVVAPSRIVAV